MRTRMDGKRRFALTVARLLGYITGRANPDVDAAQDNLGESGGGVVDVGFTIRTLPPVSSAAVVYYGSD